MKTLLSFALLLFLAGGSSPAQNFWQQVTSPTQGTIHTFLIDSADAIYAGTQFGVHKSTNDGANWISLGLSTFNVYSIKSHDGFLFASTFEAGVYRSSNGGVTWVQTNSGLFSVSIGHLAIDQSGAIYAPTFDGLFKSTNNGNTWSITGLTESNLRTVTVDGDDNVYAGGLEGAVHKSTDHGLTWNAALSPGSNIVSIFASPTTGYIYVSNQYGPGGVFRSTDRGSSWQHSLPLLTTVYFAENSAGHIFLSTWAYVYRSTDSGSSWEQRSSGLTSTIVNGIAVNSIDRAFVGTPSGAVFKSVQPTTSVGLNDGRFPLRFELAQNYPNPFNPSTTFSFSIPYSSFIIFKVYDMLGKEVRTLVNENKSAGTYGVTFDATGLPSGLYFYRLQAGGQA
ncbi:MAG: T9SS type A sorting domain-containing protein, partial [Bacteroidota bacterium]